MDGGTHGEREHQALVVRTEAAFPVTQEDEAAEPVVHQHRLHQRVADLEADGEEAGDVLEAVWVFRVVLLVGFERSQQGVAALLADDQQLRAAAFEPGGRKLRHELPALRTQQVVAAEPGAGLAGGGGVEGAHVLEREAGVFGRGQEHPVLLFELFVQRLQLGDAPAQSVGQLLVADRADHAAQAEKQDASQVDPAEAAAEADLDGGQCDGADREAGGDLPALGKHPAGPGQDARGDGDQRLFAVVALDVEAGAREDGQAGPGEEGQLEAQAGSQHGAHSLPPESRN